MKTYFLIVLFVFIFCTIFSTMETKLCNYETEGDDCTIDNFDKISEVQIICDSPSKYYILIIWPNSRMVFDQTLNVLNCSFTGLFLNNMHMIPLNKRLINSFISFVYVMNSDFLFLYDKNNFSQNFFNTNNIKTIRFEKDIRYFLNTPKIIFKDAYIKFLTFREMADTKLKSNYLNFANSNNIENLNSTIENLDIFIFKVRLDNKLLDKDIFQKTINMHISYQIEHIEIGLLNSFKYLKELSFWMFSLKFFFHDLNTKWLIGLNMDVKVNYSSDPYSVKSDDQAVVYFREYNFNLYAHTEEYKFPNEDFCLFLHFPHHNAVFPYFNKCYNTCTFQWLVQYIPYFTRLVYVPCSFNSSNNCDFDQMLLTCYKTRDYMNTLSEISKNNIDLYYFYDRNYKNKIYDFVFAVILVPIICLFGIFTNLINIIVLKNFENDVKNLMSNLMLICSYVDLCICSTYLLGLTLKCIDPIGYFCMLSLVNYKPYRYFMLTVYNYFGSVMKTLSNLIQISIAFDRFIISTSTKNKILVKLSNIKMKTWAFIFLMFSFLTNFVKLFEYEYQMNHNIDLQFRYPSTNNVFFNFGFVFSYLNLFNILMNSLFLIIIQSTIDICLINFVHKSIKAKKKLGIVHNVDKNPAERKIKLMIILNGLIVSLLHSPDLVISIFLAFKMKHIKDTEIYLDFYSFVLRNISDVFYILSYSLNVFLFYLFNSNYKKSFKKIFNFSRLICKRKK
jgi:hypothetical protein